MKPWYPALALVTLRNQVNAAWPSRSKVSDGMIGDEAHANRTSDHNPDSETGEVRAWDITADPAINPQNLADLCASDPRSTYVIFNGRINYGNGWRTYTGTNPHRTHIHVSVRPNASTEEWNLNMAAFTLLYPHKDGRFTSGYGNRTITVNGKTSTYFHQGDDIAPKTAGTVGEPVLAPCDMTIRETVSGRKPGQPATNPAGGRLSPAMSGNGVLGTPDFGPFKTVALGHFRPTARVGQRVKQGDIIGYGDLSGGITGPHIHLEVWTTLVHTTHRDPTPYLIKTLPTQNEGFLMALSDAQQSELKNQIQWLFEALLYRDGKGNPQFAYSADNNNKLVALAKKVDAIPQGVLDAEWTDQDKIRASLSARLGYMDQRIRNMSANEAALMTAIRALASGTGIDPEAIIAAAKKGAEQALSELVLVPKP